MKARGHGATGGLWRRLRAPAERGRRPDRQPRPRARAGVRGARRGRRRAGAAVARPPCAQATPTARSVGPAISGVGRRGARLLLAHVPVPARTPSRFAVLSGRLPSSSPVSVGTRGAASARWRPRARQGDPTWISVGNRATRSRACARRSSGLELHHATAGPAQIACAPSRAGEPAASGHRTSPTMACGEVASLAAQRRARRVRRARGRSGELAPTAEAAAREAAREAWRTTKRKARRSRTTAPTTATNATVPTTTRFAVPTRASAPRWSNRAFFQFSKRTFVSRRRCMCPRVRRERARRRRRRGTKTPRAPARRIASAPAIAGGSARESRVKSGGSVPETRARRSKGCSPRGALLRRRRREKTSALRAPRLSRVRVLARHREVHAREAAGREGRVSFGGGDVSVRPSVSFLRRSHGADGETISRNLVSEEMNALSDETQRRLAKCAFPLPRSDAVLRAMGVPVKCVSRTQAARLYGGEGNTRRIPEANTRGEGFHKREGHLGAREPGGGQFRPGVLPPAPRPGVGCTSRL